MTFDFSPNNDPPVAKVKAFAHDADHNCCILVGVADINDGSNDPDGPGDIASLCITKVDGVDQGCRQSVAVCGDGLHSVTLTITDLCGNTSSADASVTVQNSPPVAVAKDFHANANTACCIEVHVKDIDGGTYDPDGAEDIKSLCITDVDGTAVSCADSVTVCGAAAPHFVTIKATDWCDKSSTDVAEVHVIDITPPKITVDLSRNCLWPPNHKMVEVCADIVATDNCDPNPVVKLVSITSSEPDNAIGDGNTVGDIQDADLGTRDTCFDLRSERAGVGDGRTYTIVYSAEDFSHNIAYNTTTVCVPHDMSAGASCSAGFLADGSGVSPGATTFAFIIPGSSTFNVVNIDTRHIYVGNTAGTIKARDTRIVDTNKDNNSDLAVLFTPASMSQLTSLVPMTDTFTLLDDGTDGTVGLSTKTGTGDGPVGLHFATKDGANYLVTNIYSLGAPVDLPAAAPTKEGSRPQTQNVATQPPVATAPAHYVTALSSIHPNPFNPETSVDFTLASSERVRIAIYDVQGALVRRLVDETMATGSHQARWNGVDDRGRSVASGVYFVRMIAGSYTEVRKIVMLK